MPDLTMLAKMLDAMEERAGRMMSEYESKYVISLIGGDSND